ncbi:MAG: polysaccharide deacetylase family protein [Clostridia bacterium]|nr:polysaccharide deacetylase family protein [Clostridia bacterium]
MRKVFKLKSNAILLSIVLILTIALSGSIYITVQKNRDLSRAQSETKSVSKSLEETKSQLDAVQGQLEQEQQTNGELQSQLQQRESEKQQLEQQVAGLQQQITQLRAQKAAAKPTPAASTAKQTEIPTGSNRICYLTFDDGPSENTLQILDILARYQVKATFFVINTDKIGYVQRIAAEGHTVGLHSASHNYAAIYASDENFLWDLQKISGIVEELTGIQSRVMRFPGGGSNVTSKKYCAGIMSRLTAEVEARGYTYFDWNVSSGDATGVNYTPQQLCQNVLNGAKGKSSICVLMHDAAAKRNTVQALPLIIEGLAAQGFSFAALTPGSYGFHHAVNN